MLAASPLPSVLSEAKYNSTGPSYKMLRILCCVTTKKEKSGCLVASTNGNNLEILKWSHCNWICFSSSFSAVTTAGVVCPEDKSSQESAHLACFFVYYYGAVWNLCDILHLFP